MLDYHFLGLVLLCQLSLRLSSSGGLITVLLAFPSTFLHESAHALVGFLLGASIESFSVFPSSRITDIPGLGPRRIWTLGCVRARCGSLAAAPFALAPLIYLVPAFWLYSRWPVFLPATGPKILLVYVGLFVLLCAAIPSWQDLKILVARPKSTVLWGAISTLALISFRSFTT